MTPFPSAMVFAKGFGTPGRSKEPQTKTPLTILALTGRLGPTQRCPEDPYFWGSIPSEGHLKTLLIYKIQGRFQPLAPQCTAPLRSPLGLQGECGLLAAGR